jgi:AraC-like DNA-binding protein
LNNFYLPKQPCFTTSIHSIWQVDHCTAFTNECIIPKGVVEIIFNFSEGAPILTQVQNTAYHLPRCFITGFSTAPILTQLPQQQVFFGVVFQPMAVQKIFGYPAGEFLDSTADLTLLDKTFVSLWQQLAEQTSFDERVSVFLHWISKKNIIWQAQEQLLNNFLYANGQHDLSVTQLAGTVYYSPRQLARKMISATGMNTEKMLLYKKYLHALQLVHNTDLSMTAIAYQSQFADQSHFIKTFRSYTKMTPGEYQKNKSDVKGHLYNNVR